MSGYIGTQPVPQATQTRDSFTATSGQTSFATGGYTPNFLDVYLNGVKLASADYTASNGSDVVLASGAATGDILEVVAFTTFNSASSSIDDNGNATAITIDSSENVLVGKTATDLDVAGSALFNTGQAYHTRSGDTALYLNRLSSDGTIADFRKDGTTVGSIGVDNSTRLYFTNNTGAGLFLSDGSQVEPMSNGTRTDDTMSLGGSVYRFKDAYLSGGIYLGGTGAANKLTDYEQGTWTPVGVNFTVSGIVSAEYVKIGRQVTLIYYIVASSGTSGSARISGLPFTSLSQGYSVGSINLTQANPTTTNIQTRVSASSTHFDILTANDANVPGTSVDSGHIIGTQTYFTDA